MFLPRLWSPYEIHTRERERERKREREPKAVPRRIDRSRFHSRRFTHRGTRIRARARKVSRVGRTRASGHGTDTNYRLPMGAGLATRRRTSGRLPERLMPEPRANIPTLLVPSWWSLRDWFSALGMASDRRKRCFVPPWKRIRQRESLSRERVYISWTGRIPCRWFSQPYRVARASTYTNSIKPCCKRVRLGQCFALIGFC